MTTSKLHSISNNNTLSRDTHDDNHGILIVDPEFGEMICNGCGQVLTLEIQKSHPQWLTSFASENNNQSSDSSRRTCQ